MIFAGYPKDMQKFLQSNPGLKSRIKYRFNFPDYSVEELAEILLNKISQSGFRYEGGQEQLTEILGNTTSSDSRSQQNGRLIKNILSEAIINLSNRLSFGDSGLKLITLEAEDIVHGCKMFGEDKVEVDITDVKTAGSKAKPDGREGIFNEQAEIL